MDESENYIDEVPINDLTYEAFTDNLFTNTVIHGKKKRKLIGNAPPSNATSAPLVFRRHG